MNYKNLVEMLMDRQMEDRGITFIDKPTNSHFVSYSDLFRSAARVLYYFQSRGLKSGDELVFQLNRNLDFVKIFWACLLGNITPVPITLATHTEFALKLFNIWQLLKSPYLITFKKHMETLEDFAKNNRLFEVFDRIKHHNILLENTKSQGGIGRICLPQESDIAFIQFSSGSTAAPKGVVLTHKNLLTNINAIINDIKPPQQGDIFFSWMPLTHDMGIIGFHLVPLVAGWNHVLMHTQLFIRYPHLWLQKISKTKSTMTVSPNFGYKYVLKHFDSKKYSGLDLSSLRLVVNGAEPISVNVCEEFLSRFATYGLKRNAMFPVYGLAEASLAVSFSQPEKNIVGVNIDRNTLHTGQKVAELEEGSDAAAGISFVEVGCAVTDCFIRIVDEEGNQVDDRVIGHIEIKGDNVTGGYYNNPNATKEAIRSTGWLKTGDLGFFREGRLVITGRVKDLIFVKGQNLYSHDLEREAEDVPGIEFEKVAFSSIYNPELQADEIIAFIAFKKSVKEFLPLAAALKKHIMERMAVEVSQVIPVKKIPKTTSGKIQRFKLREQYLEGHYQKVLEETSLRQNQLMMSKKHLSTPELKELIINTWSDVLGLEKETIREADNFFDLGGNSRAALRVKARLQHTLGKNIDDVTLFKYPTINTLKDYLSFYDTGEKPPGQQREHLEAFSRDRRSTWERIKKQLTKGDATRKEGKRSGLEIAIIGMAGRFPGAKNIHEFWENIKNGVESISFFSEEELIQGGVDAQSVNHPNYIKAKGVLENCNYFDAAFFDYPPPEAEKMDPQMRLLHECSWTALEDAGYDPGQYRGLIGVYVGASPNLQWEMAAILPVYGRTTASDEFVHTQLIDKDFMTTRLSYALDLKGPSFSIYTACSTSLVAIDLACQGLLTGRCDMALAGGISIWLPQKSGYLYEEGMLFSRDGHNRTFDEQASGTIFSDGAGIVLLKRLQDAISDNDHIYAVIKGSAVNNDGDQKIGYTAPGLEGQTEVITSAQQMAGVELESISYIETHGTATSLGDTIEIDALKLIFQTPDLERKNVCALGSVKSNIGHLNAAAGVAGLIKTILALKHRLLPPSLHFARPNPVIDFRNSPFYINTLLKEWKTNGYPLRAGVSSFGIGGTNAHVILEEAPSNKDTYQDRPWKLFLLSARTRNSLDNAAKNLVKFLKENQNINISDTAYTLQVGRKHFQHRKISVCSHYQDLVENLSSPNLGKVFTADSKGRKPTMIFMFPGQGGQYINMGLGLYKGERVFREEMNRCFEILESLVVYDIKEILYPKNSDSPLLPGTGKPPFEEGTPDQRMGRANINRTEIAQPLIFIFEYALARLLMSWGIRPEVMIGYSFGEYAAACISGVLSLEDALRLVVVRGQLMQQITGGAMLSVPLPMQELKSLMENHPMLSIAIDNGPSTIVSGTSAAVDGFGKKMKKMGYLCTRVNVSHASHSQSMLPILTEFAREVGNITFNYPQIPYISNVTAQLISGADATTPGYWVKHLKDTVRFGDGIRELLKYPNGVFIEVGPGRDLGVLITGQKDYRPEHRVINLLRHEKEKVPDLYYLFKRIGHLWLYGADIDWQGFYADEQRHRIPLPTYNFEPGHFPIDRLPLTMEPGKPPRDRQKKTDISDWFYIPVWKRSMRPGRENNFAGTKQILLFSDEIGIGDKINTQLKQQGCRVFIVRAGSQFTRLNEYEYLINPSEIDDYQGLFRELNASGCLPTAIFHLWNIMPGPPTSNNDFKPVDQEVEEYLDKGFHSLIALAQALGRHGLDNYFQVKVVSNNMQDVIGGEFICPEKAALLGPVRAIGKEYGNIRCCSIDIALAGSGSPQEKWLTEQLVEEFRVEIQGKEQEIAFRNGHRWVRFFEPAPIGEPGNPMAGLRERGVYLITGGLGGVGLIMAEHLAREAKAKLILMRRSAFPDREDWDSWLKAHGEDEKISGMILKIRELEALGAEILTFSADITNQKQMQMEISRAQARFGSINGVIHAAGVGDGAMIVRRTREMSREVLAPKVMGSLVLEKIFGQFRLDFFVLCSSIASILPLPGQCAYTAANAFLDAFAANQRLKNGINSISIAWDRWQNIGLAVIAEQEYAAFLGKTIESGITAPEGVEVLRRILAGHQSMFSQVIIATTDLKLQMEHFEAFGILPGTDTPGEDAIPGTRHKRPELTTEYVQPRSEIEQKLTKIWEQFLGIDQVGIHDNFFDLGATSLGILQVNNRLKKVFAREIPIVAMYSYPTTSLLARFLNREKPENDFFVNEEHKFAKMDMGQKKLKYLKKKRITSE